MKHAKGSFVVELVLWMSVFGVLFVGVVGLGQRMVWSYRVASAVQFGAFLVGSGRVDTETVVRQIQRYLHNCGNDDMPVVVDVRRFLEAPSASFYRVMSLRVQLVHPVARIEERIHVEQEDVS